MIALYGEEFDVFPESFGGWDFFFMTLHSSYSVSQGTGYFFSQKQNLKRQKIGRENVLHLVIPALGCAVNTVKPETEISPEPLGQKSTLGPTWRVSFLPCH